MATPTTYVPPNPKKLQAQAAAQVGQEIQGQIDPLQSLVDTYEGQSTRATDQIDQMYTDPSTGLQTVVAANAKDLKSNLENVTNSQNAIFNEANARLNALRAQRASDAQALAQQLGAPVPTSMFSQPVDEALGYAAAEFGGGMLNALGLAASGVNQAEAFSGQVFPMMRARQTQEVKSYFRDKITGLQDEIASIKGQKKGLISKRQRELLTQDREFALTKTQAERDWYMAKVQAKERKASLALERDKLNASVDEATATRADQVKADKQKVQMAAKEDYAMRQDNALKIMDAMFAPGTTKVTIQTGIDADGNPVYEDVIQPGQPMTDPNRVFEKVMSAAGVNKTTKNRQFVKWLEGMIRTRGAAEGRDWARKGWVYGQGVNDATGDTTVDQSQVESGAKPLKYYMGLSLDILDKRARTSFGFKGNYPKTLTSAKARRDWLAKWVWNAQEKALAESIPGRT